MDTTLNPDALMREQNKQVTETVTRERRRLSNFIRRRVADPAEAEDILQDVFYAFVEAYRLPDPVEQVGAWLFRVARNRIIDRFRKQRSEPLVDAPSGTDEEPWLETVLPSREAGPEAAYARKVLLEELYAALDDLPEQQRAVFIAHEVEGRSFKTLAAESGVPLSTLLARKRYAVRHLRARLQTIYDEIDLIYKE
jgi:RNA polymerase sigma factor (sigma-70 family)